jgi:hypothetical protein
LGHAIGQSLAAWWVTAKTEKRTSKASQHDWLIGPCVPVQTSVPRALQMRGAWFHLGSIQADFTTMTSTDGGASAAVTCGRKCRYRHRYRHFHQALPGSQQTTADNNLMFLNGKTWKPDHPERLGSSLNHSHSIVAGGLPEMSYTTRLIPRTSLMIRFDTCPSNSCGRCAQCAVMKSSVCTARSATTYS